ncbi:MAG: FG-GAP repeat domain-containing protein [Actinomycetes bacterium]
MTRHLLATAARPALVALVAVVTALPLAAPAGAATSEPVAVTQQATPPVPVPPVPPTTPPEAPAPYVGQVSCEPAAKPGTVALAKTITATYGAASIGTLRACGSGGRSEHKDGRALDWMLDAADPADKAVATAFLQWLTGPDDAGVVAGNARRLGVMYVVWDRQVWKAWNGAWTAYTGASPHTDHIHVSLSWDGALQRTSWWTGVATERYDYGTCQVYIGELAPPYSQPRWTPCPPAVPRPALAFPRLWDAGAAPDVLATTSGGDLRLYPGTGAGGFGRAATIGRRWGGMDRVLQVGDWDGDKRRDLLARARDGRLYLYRGNGSGGFLGSAQVGSGWSGMDVVLGAGDLDADGAVDVLARRASDAVLVLYPGNGRGGFGRARQVGQLPGRDLVSAVGDWDGDGRPDLVARDPSTARLWLYPGDGRGGFGQPRAIGTGWHVIDAIVGVGDFSGDRRIDLVARRTDGTLWLYRGNGTGGFLGAQQIGWGWGALTLVR